MNRVDTRSGREAGSDEALGGLDAVSSPEFHLGPKKISFQIMYLLNDLYRRRHSG